MKMFKNSLSTETFADDQVYLHRKTDHDVFVYLQTPERQYFFLFAFLAIGTIQHSQDLL